MTVEPKLCLYNIMFRTILHGKMNLELEWGVLASLCRLRKTPFDKGTTVPYAAICALFRKVHRHGKLSGRFFGKLYDNIAA
jgi:hypothetical protein